MVTVTVRGLGLGLGFAMFHIVISIMTGMARGTLVSPQPYLQVRSLTLILILELTLTPEASGRLCRLVQLPS